MQIKFHRFVAAGLLGSGVRAWRVAVRSGAQNYYYFLQNPVQVSSLFGTIINETHR